MIMIIGILNNIRGCCDDNDRALKAFEAPDGIYNDLIMLIWSAF